MGTQVMRGHHGGAANPSSSLRGFVSSCEQIFFAQSHKGTKKVFKAAVAAGAAV
ncbi:MAG: hypothetical protein ACJAWY_002729 [Sphingomonas echinoides]|jgi:hypothetical protein